MQTTETKTASALPVTPVARWVQPLVRYMHTETASGVLLLLCTVIALFLANSPWAEKITAFWSTPINLTIGSLPLFDDKHDAILFWLNDGLMTVFFFVVGLEIKRELVAGELRDPRKAALPAFAALGGMVLPALVYLSFGHDVQAHRGWGIPMATDIAFVVGVLALLGPRVPLGLKILLLSLAIVDDIGAILVIAVAYSSDISWVSLGLAGAGVMLTVLLNFIGVRRIGIYFLVGVGIWYAMLKSGIHPTVAGVLLGLLTPAQPWVAEASFLQLLTDFLRRFGNGQKFDPETKQAEVGQIIVAAQEALSPLERLLVGLHPWVAFLIMPLFALANAGVAIEWGAFRSPVALAVAAGLLVGKPAGIFLFSWLAVKVGLARLPDGVNWKVLFGAGCLGGIGFTMSLFICSLALTGPLQEAGKLGTLSGSLVSAMVGSLLLLRFLPRPVTA
jgi:NhaA family Na+:H+ antiporter